jgi:ribosome-binding protein aMBF1 (putative translation factor)
MNGDMVNKKNQDTVDLERNLIEKFGADEYNAAMARARFKAELARTMKQRRIDLDLDQKDLALKLHTTQQQLSKYEVGENSPTADRLYDICQALNLELIVRDKEKGQVLVHI